MSVREEVIGDARLILADCRDVLPGLSGVDAVVTDPPYGIGFQYESHIDSPDEYPAFIAPVVAECSRLVGDGPCAFWQGMLNCDRWHLWFPPGFRLFAACKGFVQYRPTPVQYAWDPIVFWGRPRGLPAVERRDWHLQSLAPFGAGRARIEHPCPRPYEQAAYVLGVFTASDDVVLDPFMGSGTIGHAATLLGRSFIGIEIEPRYFDIACRRIEQAQRQRDLFVHAPVPVDPEIERIRDLFSEIER
jgi:site-specific DNA-methyltransferase (adenine-specific)